MTTSRIALSTLLVGALLACGKGDPNTPEYWVKALTDKKSREQALKDIRKDKAAHHVDGLLALMAEEGDHRDDVAQMLGQLGEKFPDARDRIGKALTDVVDYGVSAASDKTSRRKNLTNQRAVEAFGRMGYAAGGEAAGRLLETSKDQNVRLAAVTALGRLKSKAYSDKLITVVEEDDNNFMVKNAIIALGNTGEEKAIPALVNKLFFERSVSFYAESSYALFQIGKPAVPALVDVLNGKSDALKKLPQQPNPWIVKAKVVEILADIGDAKATEPAMAILKAPDSGDPFQKIAIAKAAAAAGRLGIKDAAPMLRKLGTNVDVTQAELPLEALELIGDRAAAAELIKIASKDGYMAACKAEGYDDEACKNSEAEVRQLRLEAGTRLGTAAELDAVEKMEAAEKDAAIKEMIGKEKARLVAAKECGAKPECWVAKLKDPNPKVRDKAGFELSYLKKPETRDALMAALQEDDLEARFAIFVALLRLGGDKGADDVRKILDAEEGKVQFIKINEDLKRLEIKLRRGY
ncbi:MAG: HEAT repeat domain-containing protein [Myxococcota bacterium]